MIELTNTISRNYFVVIGGIDLKSADWRLEYIAYIYK